MRTNESIMKDTTVFVPELLSPAGDMERFERALYFGADAIYLGGSAFSMRAAPSNFTTEELTTACRLAHDKNVKVYRPLLETSKDFIINYAQKHKIKYFDDLSNEEFDYHRNRIRHKIIPYLKLENPNLLNANFNQCKYYYRKSNFII